MSSQAAPNRMTAKPVSAWWEIVKLLLIAAVPLLCIVVAASISLANGIPKLSVAEAWGILWGDEAERLARLSVRELRAPRVALAILSGAALGLAGAMMQDGLRNPLAGPELLGVASGASLVVAIFTLFQVPLLMAFYPWAALVGGLLAGGVVIIAAKGARSPLQVVLVGVAVTAFINACIIALISLAGTSGSILVLFYFLLGSLANRTWDHVWIAAPWVAVCLPLGLLLARTVEHAPAGRSRGAVVGDESRARPRAGSSARRWACGGGGGGHRPYRVDRTPCPASIPASAAQRGPAQGTCLLRAHGRRASHDGGCWGEVRHSPGGDARGAVDGGAGRAGPASAAQEQDSQERP